MRDMACDPEAIAADAVALAELPGGTGRERVRIDWLNKRLAAAPGSRGRGRDRGQRDRRPGQRDRRVGADVRTDQAALDLCQEAELAEIQE